MRFQNLVDSMNSFYLLENLENYKDDDNYNYFCKMLTELYNEMIALDVIDKEDEII